MEFVRNPELRDAPIFVGGDGLAQPARDKMERGDENQCVLSALKYLLVAMLVMFADQTWAHNVDGNPSIGYHAKFYPLHSAAWDGDLVAVNHFLNVHKVDVNERDSEVNPLPAGFVVVYGNTPLHSAASRGHEFVVLKLIAAGAHVNATNDGGYTPLHSAADESLAVVSVLLAAGANANTTNNSGSTPLHSALYYHIGIPSVTEPRDGESAASIVSALLAAGADINAKDNEGNTLLSEAATIEHMPIVLVGLASGANVNMKNDNDWTPLDLAYGRSGPYKGHPWRKVMAMLIADGGQWASECTGGAIPNVHYRGETQSVTYPECVCSSHMTRLASGACK